MEAQILEWLSGVSSVAFRTAAVLFVALNGAAAAAVALTRSRDLVNRFTAPWLAANAVLLGAGLGIPLLAGLARVGVRAIAAAGGFLIETAE